MTGEYGWNELGVVSCVCSGGRGSWEGVLSAFGVLDVGLGGAVCPSGSARGVASFVGMWEGAGWDRGIDLVLGV